MKILDFIKYKTSCSLLPIVEKGKKLIGCLTLSPLIIIITVIIIIMIIIIIIT